MSVRFGSVSSIRIADGDGVHDKIVTVSGKEYSARTVIIASGSRHRPLGVEREEELVGAGVSYCAVCDGAFFAGRDVCVAGGGNTALQDAIYLSARSSKVYLIHRREQFRGDAALVDKIRNTENIEIVTPAVIERLGGEHALESVTVKYTDGREREIPAQGLLIAVGQIPQNAPFEGFLPLDEAGYVSVGEELSVGDGIFVAGDCRRKELRQLTTAVGDGAAAATKACEYIDRL